MPNNDVLNSEIKKKRLWVVSELYYPEETSTGYYVTRIAEGLVGDFEVRALCGQPNYSLRGIRAPKSETRNGVEIFRAAGTTLNKNVIAFKLINMLTLSLTVFAKGLTKFRTGDKVLVVTNPPSMPFVAAIAALCRGAHYTLLVHDNYPEILFAAGKLTKNSAMATILSFFNHWLFKHATKIIGVGRDMTKLFEAKTVGFDPSIVIIQNWAELETVQPAPKETNTLLKELRLQSRFVFLYAGNIGYPNDIETLIECADRLRGREEITFIFLGAGAKEAWLKREVASRTLNNVKVLDPKPRSEQIIFLNACDVGLVSLVKEMQGVSMPSRTYNILAAGKPILALTEPDSELAMVIDEDQVGWHVGPGEVDALYELIIKIVDRRWNLVEFGERARRSAVEKYSMDLAISKYRVALGAS